MVQQVVAPERHTGSSGDPDKTVGEGRVTLAVTVPENVGRCGAPWYADHHITERHDPRAEGLGQPDLTLIGHLRPFQPAQPFLTHSGRREEAGHSNRASVML
jgi:hypothetical protein